MIRKVLALVALAGCAIGTQATVAVAQAPDKVNVGVLRFVSSGGLFLAVERGYFKEQGLDIELKFFEAAQPIAVAVVSKDIDFGVTAITAGAFNLAAKGGLKIVGAQAKEAKGFEGNAILASNAAHGKGLTAVDKLGGKTFAITQVGSSFHYQLGQLARIKGFDLKSVDMKPLQSLPNMMAALKSNQVDAMIIAPHLAKALIAAGDAKLLGWYSEFDEYQFGALFASNDMVGPEAGRSRSGSCAATRRAPRRWPTRSSRSRSIPPRPTPRRASWPSTCFPARTPDKAMPRVKAAVFFVDEAARLDVADIYRQVAWLKSQNLVDAAADPKSFLDLGLIQGHMNVPK